jgi:hypothetical protein
MRSLNSMIASARQRPRFEVMAKREWRLSTGAALIARQASALPDISRILLIDRTGTVNDADAVLANLAGRQGCGHRDERGIEHHDLQHCPSARMVHPTSLKVIGSSGEEASCYKEASGTLELKLVPIRPMTSAICRGNRGRGIVPPRRAATTVRLHLISEGIRRLSRSGR